MQRFWIGSSGTQWSETYSIRLIFLEEICSSPLINDTFIDILTKGFLGKDLSALEYLDGITLDIVLKNSRGKTYCPFKNMENNEKKAYILIEVSCNHNIEGLIERLFTRFEELGIYEDMVSS